MKTAKEKALEIAQLMIDYKGEDVTVIDVSKLNSWTDYFVIVTINSSTHWKGLYKQVKDYVKANDLEISNRAIELKTEIEKVREQIQNIE